MLSLDLLPEAYLRLAVMLILTGAFGGFGFLVMIAFLEDSIQTAPIEYLGQTLAIGIAAVTLLVAGLNYLGIPLTKSNLSVALLGSCMISILRLQQKRSSTKIKLSCSRPPCLAESLIPFSLFCILLFLRLIQLRDVTVPPWYDGFIHTSLLQEFTIRAAVPPDYIYYMGFYAITFVVHFFGGLNFPQTVLLSGQWLSIVCGISFYIFARRFTRNPYVSGLSFVAYSFMLLFPFSLISWGQYPYLLGLTLLPPAILAGHDWISGRKRSFLRALVFIVSLGLSYSGLLLIWFSFILVSFVHKIVSEKRLQIKVIISRRRDFFRPISLIIPALIVMFFNPLNALQHAAAQNSMPLHAYHPDLGFSTQYVWKLFRSHDYIFVIFWIFSTAWTFFTRRKLLYLTLSWPLAIWILIRMQAYLMGDSLLSAIDFIVFLSIPLSLTFGILAQQLFWLLIKLDASNTEPLPRYRLKSRVSILLSISMLVGVCLSPVGIDPKTALFTEEDRFAMRWIIDHTPKDSGFLIRTTSWRNDGLIPADGGGWIPFLTGRRIVIPQAGELYDICVFARDHAVSYIYFGKQRSSDQFDLRLTDLAVDSYVSVFGLPSVEMVSLRC